MKKAIILLLIFVSHLASAEEPSDSQFAATVICPDKVSHRYEHAITLSIFGDPLKNRDVLARCVAEYNQIVVGLPQQITIIGDGNATADIVVNFKFGSYLVCNLKNVYDHGSGSIKHSTFDYSRSEADDNYTGQFTFRLLNHKLYECLGLLDCGPSIHGRPDSFWSIATSGKPDVPMAPTDIDRRIIRLAYEKVPSGTQKFKVEQITRKELSQIVVPPAPPAVASPIQK